MATTNDLAEFAATIPIDDVPPKLRCGNCNKLLLNAFRLPCCDQQICEACHLSEPKSCPVCEHEPLVAADCKPHKTVRMTVKAFLKSEEKKREKLKPAIPVITPAVVTGSEQQAPTAVVAKNTNTTDDQKDKQNTSDQTTPTTNGTATDGESGKKEDAVDNADELADVENDTAPSSPSSSVEFILDHPNDRKELAFGRSIRSQSPADRPASRHLDGSERIDHAQEQFNTQPKDDKMSEGQHGSRMMGNPNNNYNAASNGFGGASGFNNWQNNGPMDFTAMQGGMNPMWMQAMVGHMGLPAFNQMMQNPMAQQAQQMMMGNFGGQGAGMQGMNNMMNMGSMHMNMPQNMSWNQNMGGGFDAGFYPDGGFNQQGYHGHPNQRSQYNQNFVQNRRGRGPRGGGYGRDQRPFAGRSQSHVPQAFAGSAQQYDQNHSMPSATLQDDVARGTPSNDESMNSSRHADTGTNDPQTTRADMNKPATNVSEADYQDQAQEHSTTQVQTGNASEVHATPDPQQRPNAVQNGVPAARDVELTQPQFPAVDTAVNHDFDLEHETLRHGRSRSHSFARGSFESRGALRGRGLSRTNGHVPNAIDLTPKPVLPEVKGQGVMGAPSGPKAMREGNAASVRGRGGNQVAGRAAVKPPTPTVSSVAAVPQFSRSPSPSKSHRSRRKRSRSPAAPEEDDDRAHRKERKLRHSRHQSREREGSVDDSTSVHRSRGDREKHRSSRKDREHDDSREHRRRHRSRSSIRENDTLEVDNNNHSSRRDSKYRDREDAKREDKDRRRSRLESSVSRQDETDDRRRSRHEPSVSRHDETDDRRRSRHEPSVSHHDETDDRRGHRASRADKRPTEEKRATETKPQTPAPATREFEIKGSSKRKQLEAHTPKVTPTGPRSHATSKRSELEVQKDIVAIEKPQLDPYAQEREAAMRTRLLKEEQRRQSVAAVPLGPSNKRSRASMEMGSAMSPLINGANGANGVAEHRSKKRARYDESGKGRKRYKYEDDEDSHARALRVENEREAARWD